MKDTELIEFALGVIHPWEVDVVKLEYDSDKGTKTLNIYLDFMPGATFVNHHGEACKAHDTSHHTWRHLNFFEHECYLHARVPRIIDSKGNVSTVTVPWAIKNRGFTLLFENYLMRLIHSEMPVSRVAKLVNEYDQRVWTVFHRRVAEARGATDYTGITQIGVDETSSRKGHVYVTVGVDLESRRVFHVVEGKNAETIAHLAEFLDENGSPRDEVEQISIDMSPSFISGAFENLPNAQITFDRFHVTAVINKAMDELRKAERKECEDLKGKKYTLLRNKEDLSEKRKQDLQNLITLYPKIGSGYRFKELFREFWSFNDIKVAEVFLLDWCKEVEKSAIAPFMKAAKTIRAHLSGILNYVTSKITNGILEGINSKIQLAKKRARGYRNKDNFISMILFICGDLNFDDSPM
jgi:transposase